MTIINTISCSHCGAPIEFNPGEIVSTCRYCGFTQVIETGKHFNFEHSMLLNKFDADQIGNVIQKWMQRGFTKPRDLVKKASITSKLLTYTPFWVIEAEVTGSYKGIFERLTPPAVKEGKIDKSYNWVVLARKASSFPTREYEVPLIGKIPYDFRKIESNAKILNSELQKSEGMEKAKGEIKNLHQFLVKQEVDKILEIQMDFRFGEAFYLHAPIWSAIYEYRKQMHKIILDGASGTVIKGDIPALDFKIF